MFRIQPAWVLVVVAARLSPLSLAVDYIGNTEVGGPVLICTDSLSVLSALVGSKPHVFQDITKLRRKLDLCRTEIRTLWTTWERLG